jgi:dipeptidyl aminopeptidase/acylaminoacyl peptidase
MGRRFSVFTCIFAALSGAPLSPGITATLQDYARAERIRSFDDRTLGGIVFPHWLTDGVRFTYLSRSLAEGAGTVFIVDPRSASKQPLFTSAALASALSAVSRSKVDPESLSWQFIGEGNQLAVSISGIAYICTLPAISCQPAAKSQSANRFLEPVWATRSPDGKWDAFMWNYNLYIRPARLPVPGTASKPFASDSDGNAHFGAYGDDYGFHPSAQRLDCDSPAPPGPVDTRPPAYMPPPPGSIALTKDGSKLYAYGPRWKMGDEVATLDSDRYRPTKAAITWSPDSRRLVIRREDMRGVGSYPLYSSTSNHPIDHSYYYAAPGAAHVPQFDIYISDIATRRTYKADVPPNGTIDTAEGEVWSKDSKKLFVANSARDFKTARLFTVDPATGAARPLIKETSNTYVRMSSRGDPNIALDDRSGDIFWYSERDGWGHVYRYDANGILKNQVDKGPFVTADIIHVDSEHRLLYFTTWGSEAANLYNRHFYRINFDGTGLTALSPEPGDHDISWFPNSGYFLDTYQSVDRPPVTIVRSMDGAVVQTVSRGTDAPLRAIGWHPAEQFSVKARDGKTDLFGILYKPTNFDPNKHYPVIVNIYPGPQIGSVEHWRFQGGDNFGPREDESEAITHGEGMGQALAELGFIVIKLNALGTAERSKAFEDFTYANVIDNGLPDQIAAVRQLARRYSWIDSDRVGIFGHSGGGFAAAAGMLTHPEFFKVGVAESGNHDFRTYGWYWGEMYMGRLVTAADNALYQKQANYTYAANLKGKLLLIHGDMDCNNPPAQTLRLADSLIRHDKPFDLLLVGEAGHQLPPYAMRRAWDYFVDNLAAGGGTPRTH